MHKDIAILFCARSLRLFAFGLVSVVLALFLAQRGLGTGGIGVLFTMTLLGDAAIGLFLSIHADSWGRRKTLIVSGVLMGLAGAILALTGNYWLMLLAVTIGVISPSGNEVGPFLAIEQSSIAQIVPNQRRTAYIAWYHVAGFCSTALGAAAGGGLAHLLQLGGFTALQSYEWLLWIYAGAGLLLIGLALSLSHAVEVASSKSEAGPTAAHWSGLHESRGIVARLCGLFALDAFAGGFIVQSIVAYWFVLRFGLADWQLGAIFFAANMLSGFSALVAVPLAKRFGLIHTMVFTHIPSNLFLIFMTLTPSAGWAVGLLMVRHFFSQMDVPTRQSYVMAVVTPPERSAANGITAVVRSFSAALAPALAGKLMGLAGFLSAPLVLAGGLKIVYDVALYIQFSKIKPPEEH